ncbi:hypothetical protein [Virgibacillus senegalensis]|uniref:hypothetical protein n=1 Tax=Virgibacillus senegalensis TaxID=1499679 RepID=UPI00069FEE0A|nr:hypothetical protein [Virgibacillus senegalensis]
MIYSVDESMKQKFPEKPTVDTLEAELDYPERLVEVIEKEPKLVFIPKIKEPVNLLKETIAVDQLELQESPDPDSRLGSSSLEVMRIQGAMAIFTANVKRIVELMRE